jgi:agmatine/peptidylarginine deiminase
VIVCSCGPAETGIFAPGYKVDHDGLEVLALTPPGQFVGRAPSMPPERAEQEARDEQIRQENPEFFAPTDDPPPGTRAAAEFEQVEAIYLALHPATEDFTARLLETLYPLVSVVMTPAGGADLQRFRSFVDERHLGMSEVRFLDIQHDHFWTRDFGPVSIELPDGRPAFVDFRYPQTRVYDDGMPSALSSALKVPVFRIPVNVEGGVLMTNGEGLCVTTTSLAVSNQHLPFPELTRTVGRALGCSRLVFLESPRDEPTGHVDMVAKFTSPDTVLVGSFDPEQNPEDAAAMDRNTELLASIQLARGRRLRVVRIPIPSPEDGVFRSYTNSLLVNGTAVVPTFGAQPAEVEVALDAYRKALPRDWNVVTVDASDAIALGGAVHCAALELRFSPEGADGAHARQ